MHASPDPAPAHAPPRAAETRRAYRHDWHAFATWCDAERPAALPAIPATVARFLAASGRA